MSWDLLIMWLMAVWVLIPAALFTVLYGLLVRIESWAGWNALLLVGVIALIIGEALVIRLRGPWAGHDVFITCCLVLAGAAIWQRLWHLFRGTLRPGYKRKH